MHEQVRVVVAVLTFQRPDDLAELLPELSRQAALTDPPARVLVIDNDPGGGARQQVGPGVDYVHEPRPGIAAARNRALAEAAEEDLLVFVDDDERPAPRWLEHLLEVHRTSGAGGVVGPVVSRFAATPDPWITAGRFFERRALATGTPVTVAATNNLLLDLRRLRPTGLDFDERYGLTGGSDTLFTRKLVAAGVPLVWCAEAVVTDVVPAHRSRRAWVLRRAVRSGNVWSRTSVELAPGRWRVRAGLTATGGVRVGAGLAAVVAGTLGRRRAWQARGARTLARGTGMVGGAWGWTYAEYRRR